MASDLNALLSSLLFPVSSGKSYAVASW